MNTETIYNIAIKDIQISPQNVRLHDADKEIDELAASIKELGLLQPIVLLGKYGKAPYELISGQRRFLAHNKLGRSDIRCVFAGNLTKTDVILRSLVENMQRVDLNYVDTAKAITELYKTFGNDEKRVQKETGLSLRKIRDYILVEAQATTKMKLLLSKKKVSHSDVKRALQAAQGNLKKAERILDLVIQKNPTLHQKKRIVQYSQKHVNASADKIVEDAMQPHLEEQLLVTLSQTMRDALDRAIKSLKMEPEELAAKALTDWLESQGFLDS